MRLVIIFIGIFFFFSCSNQQEDTSNVDETHHLLAKQYYDKAHIYINNNVKDSAYYFLQLANKTTLDSDSLLKSKIFYFKAVIDYKNRDLPMSENNCVKALEYLPENNYKYKRYINNVLSLIAKERKDWQTAIEYLKTSREINQELSDTLSGYVAYHNNISNVYREKGDYRLALKHLDSILLISDLDKKYPLKHARSLDNKAKILIKLNQLKKVKSILDSAYNIRKKEDDVLGMIQSYINYSEYYKKIRNKDSARYNALKALALSKAYKIPKNQLDSYEILVEINLPEHTGYFEKYLKLNDSILFEQQKAKEQTALIRFESVEKEKQIEAQKQIIAKNKIRNRWFFIVLLLVTTASIIFARQLHKIRKQNQIINRQNQELNEKNTMIKNVHKDMHHRVKNNLRIIYRDLIEPVMKSVDNPEIYKVLSDLRNNIISFKNLHMLLLDENPDVKMILYKYIDKTVEYINNSLPKPLTINVNVDKDIRIMYQQIFPLILIINEFITNSYKHAFDNTPDPGIELTITQTENDIQVVIKDNGKGISGEMLVEKDKFKGLKMIFSMVEELKGTLKYRNNNGLEFIINFPKQT